MSLNLGVVCVLLFLLFTLLLCIYFCRKHFWARIKIVVVVVVVVVGLTIACAAEEILDYVCGAG